MTIDLAADVYGMIRDFPDSIQCVYRPYEGRPRRIWVMPDYNAPEMMDAMGGVIPSLVITVANHETYGITDSELNVGKDAIEMPSTTDGEQESRPIVARLGQRDPGMIKLVVRG